MAETKKLKTLTLPTESGDVTFELNPDWDNIDNKPETKELVATDDGNGVITLSLV